MTLLGFLTVSASDSAFSFLNEISKKKKKILHLPEFDRRLKGLGGGGDRVRRGRRRNHFAPNCLSLNYPPFPHLLG